MRSREKIRNSKSKTNSKHKSQSQNLKRGCLEFSHVDDLELFPIRSFGLCSGHGFEFVTRFILGVLCAFARVIVFPIAPYLTWGCLAERVGDPGTYPPHGRMPAHRLCRRCLRTECLGFHYWRDRGSCFPPAIRIRATRTTCTATTPTRLFT